MSQQHVKGVAQFLTFGMVGFAGLTTDTLTIYAVRGLVGLYVAGAIGFLVGATTNWFINRCWTFRGEGRDPIHRQWLKFLAANSIGFVINRGVYAFLVTYFATAAEQPWIATTAGAVAGMFLNFHLSRKLVFT